MMSDLFRSAAAFAFVAVAAGAVGAGLAIYVLRREPISSPPAPAAAPQLRIIERGRDGAAACDANEELVGAYCYSSPPNSMSASGVAFRLNSSGNMSLTCLTGGSQMRVVCVKKAP